MSAGGPKVFNSFGFIALVVFVAVLVTSVSLAVPAERRPVPPEFSQVYSRLMPPAQPFEQLIQQHSPRD